MKIYGHRMVAGLHYVRVLTYKEHMPQRLKYDEKQPARIHRPDCEIEVSKADSGSPQSRYLPEVP